MLVQTYYRLLMKYQHDINAKKTLGHAIKSLKMLSIVIVTYYQLQCIPALINTFV